MNEMLIGGIAVASLVASLYFFRFWRSTGDRFFLLFALAFLIEGGHRVFIYHWVGNSDETSALYYLARVVAYGLIIMAIIGKNRKSR